MIKNIIAAFFTRTSVAVFMLLNLLIVSRYLGSEVLGQLSLMVLNIAIIHAVTEIYSGSALVYFIPRLPLGRIYSTGIIWIFFCCLVVNSLMIFSAPILYRLLHVTVDFGLNDYRLSFHVLFISFISAVNAFHNVILIAREKVRSYNFMIFFQPACMVTILFVNVFLFNLRSVYACVLALYISHAIALVFSALILFNMAGQQEAQEEFKLFSVLRNGFINQVGNLAHILSNRFNYYVIGGISLAMVGVYSSATSLIESVWIISISVSPLVLTHIANRKDIANNSRMTFLLAKLCFILSLFCIVVLYFIPAEFFTALLGKDFSQTKKLMLYLSPGVLCVSFSSIISHYFSGLGRQRVLLLANVSGLIVTLLTSFPFIYLYGIVGACFTATLAYFVQALVLTILFMSQNQIHFMKMFTIRKDLTLLREPTN